MHLHNHTHYSVLDGLQKVPEMLDRIKECGMEAVAITDHGTLSATVEFVKSAQERGIKPIVGIETYVAARTIADRDPSKDKARYHLILLAMNQQGYLNLMRLSTIANLEGMYYKPRIDHLLLERYNEGLICLSGCLGGELGELFSQDQDEKAYEIAKWYRSIFGDRYYLEMQDSGHPKHPKHSKDQAKLNKKLQKLAKDLDLPLVVTTDAHYCKPEDKEAHEILLCVQTTANLNDKGRFSMDDYDLFVESSSNIINRWGEEYAEAVLNTRKIADRCSVELKFGETLIPKFDVPEGYTEKQYLDELVYQGLAARYGNVERNEAKLLTIPKAKTTLTKEVLERAEYELGVIDRMGFNGYFLVVQDFINWGKDHDIVFGPGRGSAAGSLVSYALRITDLDPLAYGLLFERFLNPDRISMPDIDIDIQDTRRDEVIAYCTEKYGRDRVSNIVTFGTMAARAAIRDVARVIEVSYAEADRLAKMIPPPVQGHHTPLSTHIQKEPDLKAEYENNPTSKKVIDLAIKLEGTIRSRGVHAAGVVIAPDELVKFIPLEMSQKGAVATQFSFTIVEELGLLKMDFLGLSNLTIVKNAMRIVKKVYGVEIDLEKMPLDDKKTIALCAAGDTTGIFQFESAGMKRYLKELKPTVFDDLIAMGALYRPGPMQFIPAFIDRKLGRKEIEYLHPRMEAALKPTYGVLVYQEQVMQISKDLCGFTGGQADTLRKAIGKKKMDVLQKLRTDFIEGAVKNSGADRKDMEDFWKQLEDFAAYCFNKSHAACYATISYWTAYLKANYPSAFMAALMTSDHGDTDRLAIEISECKRMGIEVLSPDVNQSFGEFGVVPDTHQIRFGMNAVKNVGSGAVEEILRAREAGGEFTSMEDYMRRVNARVVNRKNLESLIKAGAFDRFASRADLLYNLDTILAFGSKLQKEAASGQVNLFGEMLDDTTSAALKLEEAPKQASEQERLQWERELLGLYLSSHPLDRYDTYLDEQSLPLDTLSKEMDGAAVSVGGVVIGIRQISTKNGDKMAFVKLENKTGELELIVFPKVYESVKELLKQDKIVLAKGTLTARDKAGNLVDEYKVLVDSLKEIDGQTAASYEPTGVAYLFEPSKPKKSRAKFRRTTTPVESVAESAPSSTITSRSEPLQIRPQKLYVHVRNPEDHQSLLELKRSFNNYPGKSEAILVLGEDKGSAIKLPFTIEPSTDLLSAIKQLYGEECIALK
ncbi:MAG TPA: DNA polymerase III subunit alpha [Candidatus Saccharimonadales bacterium]|nr:DNA polymerase III subunit alpha [Candidatus Saccharimonadales bacterium]